MSSLRLTEPARAVRTGLAVVLLGGAMLAGGCATRDGAREAAATAPAGPSPEVVSRYEAALALARAGDDTAARPALLELSRDEPALAGPLVNLALLELRAGREEAALAWLAQASTVCAHCGVVWTELGGIRRRQGRFEDSERAYQRALQVEPGYALAAHNLAVLYDLYLQRPELAVQLYQQYVDSNVDPAAAAEVTKWVADLRRRTRSPETAARAEGGT